MIRAYPETYLNDAMNNLGDMFDYAVVDCDFNAEDFFSRFVVSGVAEAFERGNPKYVAGLSGPELASTVVLRTGGIRLDKPASENIDKSAEYWAGWSMAYYQWYTAGRFSALQKNGLDMNCLLSLYNTLHEADLSKFVTVADGIVKRNRANEISNLQRIRKASGMTQKELSESSGVSLRSIQKYEQRIMDINKGQAIGLANIARVLGCEVEDLLESE